MISVLLLLASATGAHAAALTLHDAGPVDAYVRGDGVRYIASAPARGATTVLDTRTGRRRTVPTPAQCSFADIHRGTLLWSCPGISALLIHGLTVDLAGGDTGQLPAPPYDHAQPPDVASYDAIGDRWARVAFGGYHYGYPAYIERATGRELPATARRDTTVDLDRATLTRRLCSGQRLPYVPDASGLDLELGDLAVAGRWAAATTYSDARHPLARVELQHCGARPRTLVVCRSMTCSQPVINDRIVAWTQTRYDATKPVSSRTTERLVVRSLAGGRTRSIATTSTAATPLLVGERLYLVASGRLLRVAL